MIRMKENLLYCSLTLFLISIGVFVLTFFICHFLEQDMKFHRPFKKVPQKPILTNMFANLGVILFGTSIVLLVLALIAY